MRELQSYMDIYVPIQLRELGIKNTGMKEFVAIVETNNCFSDGCTFGNRALVFKDYGKTAVTVARRDGVAIRIALNPDFVDSLTEKYPEAWSLFEKSCTISKIA